MLEYLQNLQIIHHRHPPPHYVIYLAVTINHFIIILFNWVVATIVIITRITVTFMEVIHNLKILNFLVILIMLDAVWIEWYFFLMNFI